MNTLKVFFYKTIHPFVRLYWRIFKPKTYGARAIILHNSSILLVKNINVDHWSLPGGKIEKGESPTECLVRELKEELDLSITGVEYKLGDYISIREGKRDTVHVFVVRLLVSKFKKQWELADARWFVFGNLPNNLSSATTRRVSEFLNRKRDLIGKW